MVYYRAFWGKWASFNPGFGLFLIFLFGIPRFILVLGANSTGDYSYTSVIFLIMWTLPFLLLTKAGRKKMGMHLPHNKGWWLWSLLLGLLMCTVVYLIGTTLYDQTTSNWLVYISRSYSGSIPVDIETHRFIAFSIYAIIGVTFSPVGEEFLYRGIIHECFVSKFGENGASIIDSSAFALTHLAHFGIVYLGNAWKFLSLPAILWVLLMFLASRLFYTCKNKGGSVYLSVLCHAGFNLAMTYYIIYQIL